VLKNVLYDEYFSFAGSARSHVDETEKALGPNPFFPVPMQVFLVG